MSPPCMRTSAREDGKEVDLLLEGVDTGRYLWKEQVSMPQRTRDGVGSALSYLVNDHLSF